MAAEVVDAVHSAGAGFLLQLWHPGAMRKVAPGHPLAAYPALSPSGLIQAGRPNGRAMMREDLAELKAAYVRAAEQAQDLGADGVELHSAHGYLLDQFLWAETNRREDEYGGATLAERARYGAEIVAAIRRVVGADFVVSSRRYFRREWPHSAHPDFTIAEWARALTDAPVMTCGSVGLNVETFANLFDGEEPSELCIERDLAFLAERVRRGTIDLVGVGRMHIANNDFVDKVRTGRFGELVLFNKSAHLVEATEAIEPGGFVEESRKGAVLRP